MSDGEFDDVGMWITVALVATVASIIRSFFGLHTMWWVFALVSHGAIFAYTQTSCDQAGYFRLPRQFHDSFCCTSCDINDGWKYGQMERIVVFSLALIAIAINIIPKYWRGDEALRHMVHVKKGRIMNPLLFHIIAGIAIVVSSGALSLAPASFKTNRLLIGVVWVSEIAHEISIHRLLSNHDGIWALRFGNMALALMKWIVLLRVDDPQIMTDMIFFQSCGFLGTRLFVTLVYIAMYLRIPTSLFHEQWYSIGLAFAQFYINARFWSSMGPVLWLSVIACSCLYFHQLWRKYLNWRYFFVAVNCLLTVLALSSPRAQSLTLTILYTCAFFATPGFKRQPLEKHLQGLRKAQQRRKVRMRRNTRMVDEMTPYPTPKPGTPGRLSLRRVLRSSVRS